MGDDVGVEGVEEVVCLVGEGRRGGGEVALACEGEEDGRVSHHLDQGLVEIVLHRLDDGAHLRGQRGHLDDLRCFGINRENPPPDLGHHEQNVLEDLRKGRPPFCEAFKILHQVAETGHEGKDAGQGDEYVIQDSMCVVERIKQLHDLSYVIRCNARRVTNCSPP